MAQTEEAQVALPSPGVRRFAGRGQEARCSLEEKGRSLEE